MTKKLLAMALTMVCCNAANAAEITHTASDGMGVILVEGEIAAGDDEKFRVISLKYRNAVVTLNSNGGRLLPAIEIGKIIKVAGYDTVVPGSAICASSCALIWTAGATRWLSPNGKVGFHASYRDNNGRLEESGVANALVGNYLTLLNLPQKAIVFATSASPNEILWLTKRNKAMAGIWFEEFSVEEGDGSSKEKEIRSIAPPPIRIVTTRRAPSVIEGSPTKLSSQLPPRLSQAGEKWVPYGDGNYIDVNSPKNANDRVYRRSIIQYWKIKDIFPDSSLFSVESYYLDCNSNSQRIVFMSLADEDGEMDHSTSINSFDQDTPYLTITPGEPDKAVLQKLCP